MATIANWNGHTFEVSPNLIRSFTDLTIEGGCETTTKNSSKQKYEERKNGESPTISLKAQLNAQLGVTDVYAEAMEFVREATEGACAYFYLGTEKLFPAKLILIKASIGQIVHLPLSGNTWISGDVQLSFKQGTKNDGSGGSGGGSSSRGRGGKKPSVRSSSSSAARTAASGALGVLAGVAVGAATSIVGQKIPALSGALNCARQIISGGKAASKTSGGAGLSHQASRLGISTTKKASSSTKIRATTGRSSSTGLFKKISTAIKTATKK